MLMLKKVEEVWEKWKDRCLGGHCVSVPVVLQMEATECGAASLAMVLAHYGMWVPLEKLREECGVNRDGSKASNVLKAARNRGCDGNGYRWLAEDLREADYPLILHWEFNHFLVLEGIRKDTVYLNDPAVGRRTVPWEEFRTSYTGIALEVVPGPEFRPEGKRYNVFRAIYSKLLADKWAAVFLLVLGFCAMVVGLASPIMSQIFIDDILTRKHLEWMPNLCLAMTLGWLLSGVMTWLRAVILTKWQMKLTLSDSSSFFWHVLKLPIKFFQQRYAAEVASRVGYNEAVAGILSGTVATSVLDLLVVIFYLVLLLQYSVTLTVIGVAFSLVDLLVFFLLRRHITDMNMRIQQDAGKAYGVAMNGLMMIESIKANGNEADFFSKWAGYQAKVLKGSQEVTLWSLTATILPTLLGGINGALIMTFGGFSIMEGVMTAGIFTAFQSLMGGFQEPFNKILGMGSALQSTEMQMHRLNDVMRYPEDSLNYPEKGRKVVLENRQLSGRLELRDVSFGYSPLDPPLLEHFNLVLEPGRWVAVVGSSGSGKSTLAKLVTGLYEEWSGEVLFDGVRRRDVSRQAIIRSVSSVDQDVFQISGTVRQNISLFDDSVPRADVIAAAKDACIHEDILQLKGGYDGMVDEGGRNFSGGQRQRLEIARSLAGNPSLLVLDEATSALDPVTEEEVLKNIRRRGCSCFVVAHRLSTIRDCDEIIVLDHGKVVERGTHVEMMRHDGPYRALIEERANVAEGMEE